MNYVESKDVNELLLQITTLTEKEQRVNLMSKLAWYIGFLEGQIEFFQDKETLK